MFFLFYYLDPARMVNGLLKTAQGVPPGVVTTLLPHQEVTMKLEAMKCLVAILKSMGDWMNKQLRIPDPHSTKKIEATENSSEPGSLPIVNGNGDEPVEGSDSHSEASNETSDALTIEQRRAYKLELQVYNIACLKCSQISLLLLFWEPNVSFVAGRYISF